MFAQLLEDLGFVIGLFFSIISVILIGMGLAQPEAAVEGYNLNLYVGLFMLAFGVFMIGLALYSRPKFQAQKAAEAAEAKKTGSKLSGAEMARQPS